MNQMQMEIIYIVGEFPSKTEYFILNEITALQRRGVKLQVFALGGSGGGGMVTDIEAAYDTSFFHPAKVWALCVQVLGRPLATLRLLRAARRFSQKAFPRVIRDLASALYLRRLVSGTVWRVHAHFANRPADVGFILSRLLTSRFSISAHAHDVYTDASRLANKIEQADVLITCTAYNKRFISRITDHRFDHKIHHIYHGLDIGKWPYRGRPAGDGPTRGEVITILTVGRLVKKKGILYLLKAVQRLKETGHRLHLIIIGEGPEQNPLKTWCADHGLQEQVLFAGHQSQETILRHFHEADIFVLPCIIDEDGDRDGLPNVIVEAMAAGVPVVATDISAISEAITNGLTGLLVPEKDEVQLSEAIAVLIHDDGYREKLRSRAREAIEQSWSIEQSTERILELFNSGMRI